MRPVGELFRACVSPFRRSRTAQLASDVSRRGRQAEAARWPVVLAGCSLGLRLCRSKSPDAGLHPLSWREPWRVASSARRIEVDARIIHRRMRQPTEFGRFFCKRYPVLAGADDLAAAFVRLGPRRIAEQPFQGAICRTDAAPIQLSLVTATRHTVLRLASHVATSTDDL